MATQLLHIGTTRFEKKVENRATLMLVLADPIYMCAMHASPTCPIISCLTPEGCDQEIGRISLKPMSYRKCPHWSLAEQRQHSSIGFQEIFEFLYNEIAPTCEREALPYIWVVKGRV